MIHLVFCIHRSRSRECIDILKSCRGTLKEQDIEKNVRNEFEIDVVFFDNLNEANSFNYRCYNQFGLYFYIIRMGE